MYKIKVLLYLFVICVTASFSGCDYEECKNNIKKECILLIDISDERLYADIKNDIYKNNYEEYLSGLIYDMNECEELKVTAIPMAIMNKADQKSIIYEIDKVGMDYRRMRKMKDPKALSIWLNKVFEYYDNKVVDKIVTEKTRILSVVAKVLNGISIDKDYVELVVFSDLLENNEYVSLLNPSADMKDWKKIIGLNLYEEMMKNLRALKAVPKLNIVQYSDVRNVKVDVQREREVRYMWENVLNEMLYDTKSGQMLVNVSFYDNVSSMKAKSN